METFVKIKATEGTGGKNDGKIISPDATKRQKEQKIHSWKQKYLPYLLWAVLLACVIGWLVREYLL